MDKYTSNMSDLVIERMGSTVTKISKAGVVLWPTEQHNAGLGKVYDALQEQREQMTQTTANNYQVDGDHYRQVGAVGTCPHCQKEIQHWDWAHGLKGLEYAATKYLARWRSKGGLESLKKAIHYTQKLIEIHFPNVAVSIQYKNKSTATGLLWNGGKEINGGKEVAGSAAAYQTAVNKYRCEYTTPGHDRCILTDGHDGHHDVG